MALILYRILFIIFYRIKLSSGVFSLGCVAFIVQIHPDPQKMGVRGRITINERYNQNHFPQRGLVRDRAALLRSSSYGGQALSILRGAEKGRPIAETRIVKVRSIATDPLLYSNSVGMSIPPIGGILYHVVVSLTMKDPFLWEWGVLTG